MTRRRPNKWEEGDETALQVHMWPHASWHVLSGACIFLLPIYFYSTFSAEISMLWNGSVTRLADLDLSWRRETKSWRMVLSTILIWLLSLCAFFWTPLHLTIGHGFIRFTSIRGVERRFDIQGIDKLQHSTSGGKLVTALKLKGRTLHPIRLQSNWLGAYDFLMELKAQRADLFGKKDDDLITKYYGGR